MKRKLADGDSETAAIGQPPAKFQKLDLIRQICADVQDSCQFPMGVARIIVQMAAASNPPVEMLADGTWMVGPTMVDGTHECWVKLYGIPDLAPFVGVLEVDDEDQPKEPFNNIGCWEGGNVVGTPNEWPWIDLPIECNTQIMGCQLDLVRQRTRWTAEDEAGKIHASNRYVWPQVNGRKWRFMVCHTQRATAQETDFNYLFECKINDP
jgi:hypothetical protein